MRGRVKPSAPSPRCGVMLSLWTHGRLADALRVAALGIAVAMPGAALSQARINTEAAVSYGATDREAFMRLLRQKLDAVRQTCQPRIAGEGYRAYALCFSEGERRVIGELFLEDGQLEAMNAEISAARLAQMERVDSGEQTFSEAVEARPVDEERIRARY